MPHSAAIVVLIVTDPLPPRTTLLDRFVTATGRSNTTSGDSDPTGLVGVGDPELPAGATTPTPALEPDAVAPPQPVIKTATSSSRFTEGSLRRGAGGVRPGEHEDATRRRRRTPDAR